MNSRHSTHGPRGGFTLLELIVVITIIGILSTIVVVSTRGLPARGRRTKMIQDCQNIYKVAEALYADTGSYPESIEAMVNAKDAQGNDAIASLEKYPTDPWGHDYLYAVEQGRAYVRCLGSDNSEGGEGEAVDYVYPEQQSQ